MIHASNTATGTDTDTGLAHVGRLHLLARLPAAGGGPDLWAALVCGHHVVVGDHYEDGTLGVFIRAGAVVPERLLREMWLWNEDTGKGRLGGKRGDRVRVRDLRGCRSDGLFYGSRYTADGAVQAGPSWDEAWSSQPGLDVTAALGVRAG